MNKHVSPTTNKMSSELFGGATSSVAEVGKQLAEMAKLLGNLTEEVRAKRNPNLMADAVVMPGECPSGLIGCNANELYNKTGGELTCPPLEQAPDPLIVDYKGRVCYAPPTLEEQWRGKNLNIHDLMEKYSLKLVKMLEQGNNLQIAVEQARNGPKGSPIILNYYASNPFVRAAAAGASMFTGTTARADPARAADPAFDISYRDAGELAAALTKFSNMLDVNSGAEFFNTILRSTDQASLQGIFDVVSDDFAAAPVASPAPPGGGLAAARRAFSSPGASAAVAAARASAASAAAPVVSSSAGFALGAPTFTGSSLAAPAFGASLAAPAFGASLAAPPPAPAGFTGAAALPSAGRSAAAALLREGEENYDETEVAGIRAYYPPKSTVSVADPSGRLDIDSLISGTTLTSQGAALIAAAKAAVQTEFGRIDADTSVADKDAAKRSSIVAKVDELLETTTSEDGTVEETERRLNFAEKLLQEFDSGALVNGSAAFKREAAAISAASISGSAAGLAPSPATAAGSVAAALDAATGGGAASAPTGGYVYEQWLAGGADGINERFTATTTVFPTHALISNLLFQIVVMTSKDSVRRAKFVTLINSLAQVLRFGDLGNANTTGSKPLHQQAVVSAAAAIDFLPKGLRDWLGTSGSSVARAAGGYLYNDPRIIMTMFIRLSAYCTAVEAYSSGMTSGKYMTAVKGLREAYDKMRSSEEYVTQLLKKKADGESVFQTEVDEAMRNKVGAAQGYVTANVTFGKLLAKYLDYDFASGNFSVTPSAYDAAATSLSAYSNSASDDDVKRATENFVYKGLSIGPQLRGRARPARGRAGAGIGIFRTDLAKEYFTKVENASKLSASRTSVSEDEIFMSKAMFKGNAATAQRNVDNAEQRRRELFSQTLGDTRYKSFCKVELNGKPAFLSLMTQPTGAADNIRTAIQEASDALKNANYTDLATALGTLIGLGTAPQIVAAIAQTSCKPLESESDFASVRLRHVLSNAAPDRLFASAQNLADVKTMQDELQGMNLNQRDRFSQMLIILHAISGDLKSADIAAHTILTAPELATVLPNFAGKFSPASLPPSANGSSRGFAVLGALKGGDVDIEGGEDWEGFAESFLSGGAVPAHSMPDAVHKYVSGHASAYEKSKEIKELDKKLASQGYKVTSFYSEQCPSYLKDTNNTFGAPNEKRWVETKHAWAKCQEQMGFQFVSKNGFCYPYGMTCYPEDDLISTTHKTAETMDNWIQLAKVYNNVQQKKYVEWLQGEKARIRAEPQNEGLTDKEVEDLAKQHIPKDLQGIPEFGAVQTLVTLGAQLEDAVSEITSSSDIAQREAIKRILRDTRVLEEEWVDSNAQVQNAQMDAVARGLIDSSKDCTTASLAITNKLSEIDRRYAMNSAAARGATGFASDGSPVMSYLLSPTEQAAVAKATECATLPTGPKDSDVVLIPKKIESRIDREALARGEPTDPIVDWWRKYYQQRVKEDSKKTISIASKVSPFEVSEHRKEFAEIPRYANQQSAETVLEASLKRAVGKRGVNLLEEVGGVRR